MAERNKLQHIRSVKVDENTNMPKLPTEDKLVYGEIAINYHKGVETISLKNDNDEIVSFHDEVEILNGGTPKPCTEIFIDLSDTSTTELCTKAQVESAIDGITDGLTDINNRIDSVSTECKENIIIGSATNATSSTEIVIDTNEVGDNYEVYTRSQVDALISNLQSQIDALKNG